MLQQSEPQTKNLSCERKTALFFINYFKSLNPGLQKFMLYLSNIQLIYRPQLNSILIK